MELKTAVCVSLLGMCIRGGGGFWKESRDGKKLFRSDDGELW